MRKAERPGSSVRCAPTNALDCLRGLLAVLVVLGHAREILLFSRGLPPTGDTLTARILLAPTSLAQEAVAIFFVLSGYLVGGQIIQLNLNDKFTWHSFAARRLSRLTVVLVPGLVFSLVLDHYARVPSVPSDSRPSTLLCNALFLQGPRCPTFASNVSLWSLSYEFWFYLLFAGCASAVFSVRRSAHVRALVGLGVVAVALVAFGPILLTLIPAWLLGAGAAVIRRGRLQRNREAARPVRLLAVALLVVAVLGENVLNLDHVYGYVLVGLATVPLLLVLPAEGNPGAGWPARAVGRMGVWSYTMYVFHAPIVVALVHVALRWDLGGMATVAEVYLLAGLTIVLCRPCWWLGEAHTARLRAFLSRPSVNSSPAPVLDLPAEQQEPAGEMVIDLAGRVRA